MEEWRDVVGYEGLYQVSNAGAVKSLPRVDYANRKLKGKVLKLRKDKNGYIISTLYKDGIRKDHSVHRLVASAFIENPDNFPQVNHKDENPGNNNVTNLEWCTNKYNSNYGTRLQRISKAQKGIPKPSSQGERNFFYGKRFCRGNSPSAKKVYQFSLDMMLLNEYDSVVSAAESVNVSPSAIGLCCRKERKSIAGYIWRYENVV